MWARRLLPAARAPLSYLSGDFGDAARVVGGEAAGARPAPSGSSLGIRLTVNAATVLVALAAGAAGILSFETRAGSAVGVAISITTIPAAVFLGVAFAEGDSAAGGPAAAVLAVNVVMLVLAGTLTLLFQRRLDRARHAGSSLPAGSTPPAGA